MAKFFGDAASVLMKVLMRKSISLFAEFSYLFIDLASLVVSALRFSTIVARQPSSFPPHPSTSSTSAAAAAASTSASSARRYSPILMSMAIRHRVY